VKRAQTLTVRVEMDDFADDHTAEWWTHALARAFPRCPESAIHVSVQPRHDAWSLAWDLAYLLADGFSVTNGDAAARAFLVALGWTYPVDGGPLEWRPTNVGGTSVK